MQGRRSVRLIGSLLLAMVVAGVAGTWASAAQDEPSTDGHPLVGTWIIPADGDAPSLVTLSSDGTLIDLEASRGVGLGSWSATSDSAGVATFVLFIDDVDMDISGTLIVRVVLQYDPVTDSAAATYSATLVSFDGTVLYADRGEGRAVRLAPEPPEMMGTPIPALIVESAG